MEKTERFGFWLSSDERLMLSCLAKFEGGLSQAALIRRLIRKAASDHGFNLIGLTKASDLNENNSMKYFQSEEKLNG